MWGPGKPSFEEALLLLKVYVSITKPERRRHLFELAQKYAREPTQLVVVEGDMSESS